MRKKLLIGVVLAPIAAASGWCLLTDWSLYGEGDKVSRAKADLDLLARALRVVTRDDTFTPADWDKINTMKDLVPHLAPRLEQGEHCLFDTWGNPLILEKREQGDEIFITIRSSKELRRRWCQLQLKRPILGVEITVSRQDGQVANWRELWR